MSSDSGSMKTCVDFGQNHLVGAPWSRAGQMPPRGAWGWGAEAPTLSSTWGGAVGCTNVRVMGKRVPSIPGMEPCEVRAQPVSSFREEGF